MSKLLHFIIEATYEEDYIKDLVNIVTVNNEEESDDDDFTPYDTGTTTQLDIEGIVDLLPQVVIDPTYIPQCTQFFDASDNDDESDFDVTDLVATE